MERKVGSKFELGGIVLKVIEVEGTYCQGCYMYKNHLPCTISLISDLIGSCTGSRRSDKKDVIFEEVK